MLPVNIPNGAPRIKTWQDSCRYLIADDPKPILKALFKTGVITRSLSCPTPDCNGTMVIKQTKSKRNRYPFVYACPDCKKTRAITTDSIYFHSKWSLEEHWKILTHYCLYEQHV